MTTFNLQKHLDKIASQLPKMTKLAESSYEGAQGYFVAQTRSWQNCARKKMLKGSSAHEAWTGCLEEYQKATDNIDWVSKNCVEDTLELQKNAQSCGSTLQMGSYLEKIKKHHAEGNSLGQSVMAALKDCEAEAKKIHESAVKGQVKTAIAINDPNKSTPGKYEMDYWTSASSGEKQVFTCEAKDSQDCYNQFKTWAPSQVWGGSFKVGDIRKVAGNALKPGLTKEASGVPAGRCPRCQKPLGDFSEPGTVKLPLMHMAPNGHIDSAAQNACKPTALTPRPAVRLPQALDSTHSVKTACACCGCGNHGNSHECKCDSNCKCKQTGGTCKK